MNRKFYYKRKVAQTLWALAKVLVVLREILYYQDMFPYEARAEIISMTHKVEDLIEQYRHWAVRETGTTAEKLLSYRGGKS